MKNPLIICHLHLICILHRNCDSVNEVTQNEPAKLTQKQEDAFEEWKKWDDNG